MFDKEGEVLVVELGSPGPFWHQVRFLVGVKETEPKWGLSGLKNEVGVIA